ncbi:porin family protein [Campylobacter sp. FMV-PI01]|uniref:Porin family protein n=1 Tax=Campylobacter portucalensis TaxID=2608384 RepID=A0A6L5WH73_9BACT|nr:outer membrane beta-barrel protein [Campylobacter portucalensis]MSN95742.1 porin family protein [Campylobacter portucalensis]
MKNLVKLSFVASLLVASSLNAHKGAFVGFEGGYNNFSLSLETKGSSSEKFDASKSNFGLGIKGGYSFGEFRVYGAYEYISKIKHNKEKNQMDATIHEIYLGADWTPEIATDLRAVIGAYTGSSIIHGGVKINKDSQRGTIDYTVAGWLIGAKLGLEYIVADHHGIEVGMKYNYTEFSNFNDDQKFTIDDITNKNLKAYLGYSYYF